VLFCRETKTEACRSTAGVTAGSFRLPSPTAQKINVTCVRSCQVGPYLSLADWPSLDKEHALQPTFPELFAEDTECAIGDQYQQHDDVAG
jgi:hypothetical protein